MKAGVTAYQRNLPLSVAQNDTERNAINKISQMLNGIDSVETTVR